MEHVDIIKALDELIGEGYDPAKPEIDPMWRAHHEPTTWPPLQLPTGSKQAKEPALKKPPIVGCVIQASDRQRREKLAWLTATPPPLPPTRRPTGPANTRPPPDSEPHQAVGSVPPPPIPVQVEPGHVINVPHFAAHVSRQFKTRSRGAKWHIRFNGNGTVRSVKKK